MFCTECGTENRNDRKFCTNCGASLRDYTKPRENLLMPEDIKQAQSNVQKRNLSRKAFNIAAIVTLMLLIISIVLIFFTHNTLQKALIIASIALFMVFVLIVLIRSITIKKLNKQIKK